jgi:hypothetical protein
MAGELDTRDASRSEVSTTTSAAAEACELRRKGRSLGYILDRSPYASTHELVAAMKTHMAAEQFEVVEDRMAAKQMQIDAINDTIAQAWEIIDGNPQKYDKGEETMVPDDELKLKALKAIQDGLKQRQVLMGLADADPQDAAAKTQILIIGGQQAEFIADLKGAIKNPPADIVPAHKAD